MSSLDLNQVDTSEVSVTANGFVEAVGVIIQRVKPRSTEEVQIYSNSMSVLTKDKEIMTRNSVWGVFPLVDNYAYESYFYLITVHTGLRKSAGTKSNVFFCLFGQDDETGVRKLSDGIKEGFPTGSVCHFVMACPKCLGDLQCLKIWHDNSGKGNEAPWFLDRIEIVDIQTRKAYYFICEEWLAAEYTLETTIEATSVNELEKIKSLFLSNTKQHLTDDHIWLSVFIRPDNSRFSRVERTACCLAFLLLAMITSAMFYTGVPDANRKQPKVDFEIGPIRIGYQQLYYSFLSAVITALPMLIIVTLFRKARTKRDPSTGLCKNKIREYEADEDNEGSEELQKTWPQAFRYIAWIIIAIAVVASSFFVILYSTEWGKDITEQWLTTFFLAFLQSLFVLDPFKVIVISVCLAILVKKVKLKGLDELDLSLIVQVNEEYGLKQRQDHSEMQALQSAPLSKLALQTATLRQNWYSLWCSTRKTVYPATDQAKKTQTRLLPRLLTQLHKVTALNKLKENINNYINFNHIVVWDSSFTLCLAMFDAIVYLRLLRLVYMCFVQGSQNLPRIFFLSILNTVRLHWYGLCTFWLYQLLLQRCFDYFRISLQACLVAPALGTLTYPTQIAGQLFCTFVYLWE
ncbi:Polycystic kidney disease protein 1-like 2 [Bulinus truncatus]|nr:Polycystic kidney disease protein 1-like 2 [Bulinus truncatus]